MIRYALKCDQGHAFESWFKSAEAFDALLAGGHVGCVICGSSQVEKALMAPAVRPARKADSAEPAATPGALTQPASPAEEALAEMRRKIEESSDYVGDDFAREARAMHNGEAPERAIHGEARLDEARALLEDGVPVMPLPFAPKRRTN